MDDDMKRSTRGNAMAHEEAEVDEVIARCPELASLPDWFDAAQRLLMDLDSLDDGLDGIL